MHPYSIYFGLKAKEQGAPYLQAQRVLGTVMRDTFPNHNSNSEYRNPTFYYIGTLDPYGGIFSSRVAPLSLGAAPFLG